MRLHDELIEAMARGMRDAQPLGDDNFVEAATAAYSALREKLVPVEYHYHRGEQTMVTTKRLDEALRGDWREVALVELPPVEGE